MMKNAGREAFACSPGPALEPEREAPLADPIVTFHGDTFPAECCENCESRRQEAIALAAPAPEPPRPIPEGVREAAEDNSPFAVADSVEEGRALEHCQPADLPAATYLKGLVYRLVGAYDRVEMRRRALWDSHGKLLIQQKVAEKLRPRPSAEWHEDFGEALWFVLPIREAPYCGSPLADDWPFGEDGDDEGATWPTLTEDQSLVWVPVEPIARFVDAALAPSPAPEVKPCPNCAGHQTCDRCGGSGGGPDLPHRCISCDGNGRCYLCAPAPDAAKGEKP